MSTVLVVLTSDPSQLVNDQLSTNKRYPPVNFHWSTLFTIRLKKKKWWLLKLLIWGSKIKSLWLDEINGQWLAHPSFNPPSSTSHMTWCLVSAKGQFAQSYMHIVLGKCTVYPSLRDYLNTRVFHKNCAEFSVSTVHKKPKKESPLIKGVRCPPKISHYFLPHPPQQKKKSIFVEWLDPVQSRTVFPFFFF